MNQPLTRPAIYVPESLTRAQMITAIKEKGLWHQGLMEAARAERLERVITEILDILDVTGPWTAVHFGWTPGSESGLPMPSSVTVLTQTTTLTLDAGSPDMEVLDTIPSYQDWLDILEENHDPSQSTGGVITLTLNDVSGTTPDQAEPFSP